MDPPCALQFREDGPPVLTNLSPLGPFPHPDPLERRFSSSPRGRAARLLLGPPDGGSPLSPPGQPARPPARDACHGAAHRMKADFYGRIKATNAKAKVIHHLIKKMLFTGRKRAS